MCTMWKTVSKRWVVVMKEMERFLKIWLRVKKNISVSHIIPTKAAGLYTDWKKCIGKGAADIPEFQACKGRLSLVQEKVLLA